MYSPIETLLSKNFIFGEQVVLTESENRYLQDDIKHTQINLI